MEDDMTDHASSAHDSSIGVASPMMTSRQIASPEQGHSEHTHKKPKKEKKEKSAKKEKKEKHKKHKKHKRESGNSDSDGDSAEEAGAAYGGGAMIENNRQDEEFASSLIASQASGGDSEFQSMSQGVAAHSDDSVTDDDSGAAMEQGRGTAGAARPRGCGLTFGKGRAKAAACRRKADSPTSHVSSALAFGV
eukprot:6456026-Prymnesium_polylepis.1